MDRKVVWDRSSEHGGGLKFLCTEVVSLGWMLGWLRAARGSGWVEAAAVAFVCPVHQLIALKPQLDLPLGLRHGVAGMDDIPVPGDRRQR